MMPIIAAAITIAAPQAESARTDIAAALAASAAAWNAGDLPGFVEIYANDAVYVSGERMLRGKAEITEHYRPSFAATGNVRGKLSLQPLAWRAISNVHQLLVARWTLKPEGLDAKVETGMTTLLFERRPEGWRIISDHSS